MFGDRDKLNYDFDVYFLGFQKNLFKFMARSKLFVFPSLWKGWAMSSSRLWLAEFL